MMQRKTTSQLARKAWTRFSLHGLNPSAVFVGITVSAALLAGSATGSPIRFYSDPVFPGHGHYESGSGISASRIYGIHGHRSFGKSMFRRWSASHSLKAVDGLGFGRFDHEEPFRCDPDPLDPEIVESEQDPQPELEPSLLNPPTPSAVPSAVPEPGTWALFALGLAGIRGLRSLRKPHSR